MSSGSPSPSPPCSQQFKRRRRSIPREHKEMLRFIMFQENGGALNNAYQKGLKKNNGNVRANFWPTVTKMLNEAVDDTYNQEVMICRN